jgi:hypothetical protein
MHVPVTNNYPTEESIALAATSDSPIDDVSNYVDELHQPNLLTIHIFAVLLDCCPCRYVFAEQANTVTHGLPKRKQEENCQKIRKLNET